MTTTARHRQSATLRSISLGFVLLWIVIAAFPFLHGCTINTATHRRSLEMR